MSVHNIYDIVNGIKTHFETDFPAQLRTVEASIKGGILLSNPALYVLAYADPFAMAHPFMCFSIEDAEAPASANHAVNLIPDMYIRLIIAGTDPDKLERDLLLYSDAVFDFLGKDESLGSSCHSSEIIEINFDHAAYEAKNLAGVGFRIRAEKEIQT